ncbi:hypothetical protein GUJ93_ZPchr0004g39726 [Zizania palustris]|uniref:Uncharacterized protein n=1 Tax=Zizania palustris TaxID=103762 RepID=A0A8J5VYZ4_ZIZPA|nr:hypothetical protein GUJ93_ZPchr0004g39726 [Zizania palustris]
MGTAASGGGVAVRKEADDVKVKTGATAAHGACQPMVVAEEEVGGAGAKAGAVAGRVAASNRKRKQPTSSGAANSNGTGNTVGPSTNSPPSTPSTHMPGDGLGMTGNMRHVPKNLMVYGVEGTGLATSSNQMDDLEPFGDVGSLDDNVESFLSNDDGDARDIFAALKKSPAEPNPAASKGFTFNEVNCWRTSSSKIVCCHFSSDGKILASAGHEKKPGFSLHTFTGHGFQITSLDFHPKKTELLCSCDSNGEIRYWNMTQLGCMRATKGGTSQVRFQPNTGQFLAAAAENMVSIFDVETHAKKYTLQGHSSDVLSVCWDNRGECLASVSQNLVKVWSISSGECIHESLELWNMVKNQSMTVQAHEGLISALAQSPVTGMVASASHDNSVKLWK